MASGYLHNATFLVQGPSFLDITAEVTDKTGWTNLSNIPGTYNIEDSAEVLRRPPWGGKPRGPAISGAVAGSFTFTIDRRDGMAGKDAAMFFESCMHSAAGRRFNFVLQPDGGSTVLTDAGQPAATPANPMYAGSGIIQTLTPFAEGANGAVSAVAVQGELDRDFDYYR